MIRFATAMTEHRLPIGVVLGVLALGSAVWGALASRQGVPAALMWSALAMILGLTTIRRHRLTAAELKLAPAVVRD